jgi:hypothetical protein
MMWRMLKPSLLPTHGPQVLPSSEGQLLFMHANTAAEGYPASARMLQADG